VVAWAAKGRAGLRSPPAPRLGRGREGNDSLVREVDPQFQPGASVPTARLLPSVCQTSCHGVAPQTRKMVRGRERRRGRFSGQIGNRQSAIGNHFRIRLHAARGTTNDENGTGGRWRQAFGVRPSSGAATALCSRVREQTTDLWKLSIAAPEDGRTPAQSVFHPCFIRG